MRIALLAIALFAGAASLLHLFPAQAQAPVRAGGSLEPFRSDMQLRTYLKVLKEREEERYIPPPPPPPSPPPAPVASESSAAAPSASAAPSAASDKITNVQEAGVDEGGIVKKRGDLLVILRRGRLFTVSIADGKMRPVDTIDAMPPGASDKQRGGDWYDEMLVSGDQVVVVGYSYRRGGTEINRFHLSPEGKLTFRDSHHLRSNDYYSSRNYASRLIGNRLIYYTPLYLDWDNDPFEALPALRRWTGDKDSKMRRIVRAGDVYVVPRLRDDPEADISTAHSVMDCDLAAPVLDCRATVVLGPDSRTFYVSPSAVYLWVSDAWHDEAEERGGARAFLYRLPLGRERPSAIAARGSATDQFSFREDPRHGLLDILLRADGGGDAMWNPEVSTGDVALLSVPIRLMGNGRREVPLDRYRPLPSPGADLWNFQNRFVGNHVLYGARGSRSSSPAYLVAAALRGGPVARIELRHEVERLDILGQDGVVIGSDRSGGLNLTAIDLRRPLAQRGPGFRMPDAAEGESRSHAFFYRPDNPDGSDGLLGLPISRRADSQFRRYFGSSASILFLRRDKRRFALAGELAADPRQSGDDQCKASCVDWYGNARPIFIGDRLFALMGYELVEGALSGGTVREVGRMSFQPGRAAADD